MRARRALSQNFLHPGFYVIRIKPMNIVCPLDVTLDFTERL